MMSPCTRTGNRTKKTAISPSESPSELASSGMPGSILPRPSGGLRVLHQRDEADGPVLGALEAVALAAQHDEALVAVADRGDQATAVGELLEQRAGERPLARGGDVDRVERRLLGPALRAVSAAHGHVVRAERAQRPARAICELGVQLDAVDVPGQPPEHRGVVPRPGADV